MQSCCHFELVVSGSNSQYSNATWYDDCVTLRITDAKTYKAVTVAIPTYHALCVFASIIRDHIIDAKNIQGVISRNGDGNGAQV